MLRRHKLSKFMLQFCHENRGAPGSLLTGRPSKFTNSTRGERSAGIRRGGRKYRHTGARPINNGMRLQSERSTVELDLANRELAAAAAHGRNNRRQQSLIHYKQAVQLVGRNPAILPEVVRHLKASSDRSPKDAALRHLLGAAYFLGKDYRNAEAQLRKAATLSPTDAPILCMFGDSLMRLGKTDEALTAYRQAVAAAPTNREARTRLAGLLAYRGERAASGDLYRQLIEEGVSDPLVYSGLIEVSDYAGATSDPPEYSAAISLAENPSLPAAMRRMLHFSAAKVDRARQRRDLEFAHYLRGKENYPYRFDLTYFSETIAALKAAVTPQFIAERAAFANKSARPILIFGMPRSGTTLTEQILAAHPSVAAGGELTFFPDAAARLGLAAQRSDRSLPPERIAERLQSLDKAELRQLAAQYSNELQRRGGGKARVTDKMPENFLHLWLIALLFPAATYIHCVREPVATCFSCFTTDLSDSHAYTQDFATLAGYYRIYEDLMRHWAKVLPVAIVENRYEALVAHPEGSVRRLLEAARLPWDPACLAFHESDRVARTASYAAVREPINPHSLERWRAYADYLGPLFKALGVDGHRQGATEQA